MSKVPAVVERQGINQALWDTMGGVMQKSTLERSQALEAGNFTFDAAKQEIVINPPAASQLASAPLSPEAQQNVNIASAPIQVKPVTLADSVRVEQMILGTEAEDKQFLASLGIVGRSPNMSDITRLEKLLKSTPSPPGAGATSGPPAAAPAPISTFKRRGVEEAIGEIGRGQLRRPIDSDIANVERMVEGKQPLASEYLKEFGLSGDMPTADDVNWLRKVAGGIPLDAMGNFDREAAIAMGNRALNPTLPVQQPVQAPIAPPPAPKAAPLVPITLASIPPSPGLDVTPSVMPTTPPTEFVLPPPGMDVPAQIIKTGVEPSPARAPIAVAEPVAESPVVIDEKWAQAMAESLGAPTEAEAMQAQVDALAQAAEKIFGTPVTIEQLEMMVATNPKEVVNRVVAYGPSTDSYILLSKMGITAIQYDALFAEEAERQRVEKESRQALAFSTLPKAIQNLVTFGTDTLANILRGLAATNQDMLLAELRARGDTPEVRQALREVYPEIPDEEVTALFAEIGGKETEAEKQLRLLFPEEDPIALATLAQEQPELLKQKLENMPPSPERANLRNLLYGMPATAEELGLQPADPDSLLAREWPEGVPLSVPEGMLSDEEYKKIYAREPQWSQYKKDHPEDIRLTYRDTFTWADALNRVKRDWEGSAGYLPIQAETPIGRALGASYDTGWKYPGWIPLIGDTPITIGVEGAVELAISALPLPAAAAAAASARAAVKAAMAAGNIPKAVGWAAISLLPTAAEYLVEKPLALGLKWGLAIPTKAVQGAKSLFGKGATEASVKETLELSLDKGLVDFAKKQGWSEADMNTAANFYLKDNTAEYSKIVKEALEKSAGDFRKATQDIIKNLEPGLKKAQRDATIAMATVGQAPDVAEAIVKVADDVAKGKVPATAEAVGARVAEEAKVINPAATEVKIVKTPAMVEEAARKGVPVSELEGASADDITAKVIDIVTPEKPKIAGGAPELPVAAGEFDENTAKLAFHKMNANQRYGGINTELNEQEVEALRGYINKYGNLADETLGTAQKIWTGDTHIIIGTFPEKMERVTGGRYLVYNPERNVYGIHSTAPDVKKIGLAGETFRGTLREDEFQSGVKDWLAGNRNLGGELKVTETKPTVPEAKAIPKAAEGMPEVGLQTRFTPEGDIVTEPVFPKGKGVETQASLEAFGKLEGMKAEAAKLVSPIDEQVVGKRLLELDTVLTEKGRIPPGMGTRTQVQAEVAKLRAKQDIAQTIRFNEGNADKVARGIEKTLSDVSAEIDARAAPFHAGMKNKFPEYTTKQLDVMAKMYDDYLQTITPSTPKQWDALPIKERAKAAKQAGLGGETGSKAWQQLDNAEKEIITRSTDEGTLATLKGLGADLPPEMAAKVKRLPPLVTAGGAGMDPADKLTMMIKNAKSVNKDTLQQVHIEKQRRVAVGAKVLEKKIAAGEGEEAFFAARGALKGELPKSPRFQPPRPLMAKDEVVELFQRITQFERAGKPLQFFQQQNAAGALTKLLDGIIPQRKQLMLLEEIFGPDLVKAVLGKRPLSAKVWENFVKVMNLPRMTQTVADASAMLRQGIMLMGEKVYYTKAFPDMLKATWSTKNLKLIDDAIKSHPHYSDLEDRIFISPIGETAALGAREEAVIMRIGEVPLVKRILRTPVLKQTIGIPLTVVEASQRAYTGFLNSLRANTFYRNVELYGTKITEHDMDELAKFINPASGRGSLGPLENASAELAGLLYAPRRLAGLIQAPFSLFSDSALARRVAAKNLAAFAGAVGATLALLKVSGVAEVELDPRSSSFGKAQIGNTKLDFTAGYQKILRYTTQLITERSKSVSTGEISKVERDKKALAFARSYLAPGPTFLVDAATGENIVGDEIFKRSIAEMAFEEFAPLTIQDIVEAIEIEGGLGGVIAGVPSFFGVGATTFKTLPPATQREWQDSLEEYGAIPKNAMEREKWGIDYTPEDYRENNPEADAKLFILGDVSTIQTIEAIDEVLRLIEENKIDWKQIRGIEQWMENAEARKKYGLPREVVNTPTEMLLKRLLGDDSDLILGDEAYEKIATLTEKNKKEQEEFDAIRGSDLTEEKQLKDKYLDEHKEFARRQRMIDAYGEGYAGTDQYSQDQFVEDWADYYLADHSGFEDDWFFQEHPDFYRVMTSATIRGEKAWTPRDFSLVPTREVAAKYDEWKKQKGDAAKWDYLETWANQDLRDYVNKEREAEGVKKGLTAENAKLYAEYYSMQRTGYADDWWLQEHKDYYEEAVDKGILTGRDFSKVPTREVAKLYDTYQKLERQDPKYGIEMRLDFPQLENWGVLAKKWLPLDEELKEGSKERIFRTEVNLIPLKAQRDALATEAARNAWDAQHPEYQQALTWLEAAKLPFDELPEGSKPYSRWEFENDYLAYKGEERKGYEDDWFWKEHSKFYDVMVDLDKKTPYAEGWEDKLPSREQVAVFNQFKPEFEAKAEDHEKGVYDQSQFYIEHAEYFKAAKKIADPSLKPEDIDKKLADLKANTPTPAEAKALQKYVATPTDERTALRRSDPAVDAAVRTWRGLQPLPAPTATPLPASKFDFRKATQSDWESLPDIGPSLAKKILDDIAAHGSLKSIDDLDRVPGIGPATIAKIKKYLGLK